MQNLLHWLKLPVDLVRNRLRGRTRPRYLTYIVTFACNARCIMCDSWQKPPQNELTLAELDRICAQLPRMDAVRLSGGEPFVRTDFEELAAIVQQRLQPALLHITTNGFLTRRIVDFCVQRDRATPLQLLISLDGMKDKHNQVRGHKNAWRMAQTTLAALAPRRRELNLSLAVNQTITDREGIAQYRELRQHLAQWGIHNQVVLAYDDSATYNSAGEALELTQQAGGYSLFGKELQTEDLRGLFADLRADSAHYRTPERLAKRYYLRGIENRLLHGKSAPNPPCVALNAHMRLFPDGAVPTCQFNSHLAGNLREQSFHDVWFGATAQRQRAWVNRCPGCWAECEVLPSAIYTGDLFWPR